MELTEIRKEIDTIDGELLSLFLQRMELSADAAKYKAAHNIPIPNRQREREILAAAAEKSGELERYSHRLFTTVLGLSRARQSVLMSPRSVVSGIIVDALERSPESFPQTGTVACQGVEGAYSQMAADKLFPRGNVVFFHTFDAVCAAVEGGLCQFGVLPVENSTNGSVRAVYSLLRERSVSIVRATRLCIRHELFVKPGVKIEEVTEIYSHEQALGQCSEFLKDLGDGVRVIPCENTAVAAKRVSGADNLGAAAISSHSCGELYGLASLRNDIQNSDNNYTRFICIAKTPDIYPGANRVSLILALRHRPGALYEALSELAARGVNLLKLESYPISGHDFEFMFFLDMEASVMEPEVATMLAELERASESFKYLGNYLEV